METVNNRIKTVDTLKLVLGTGIISILVMFRTVNTKVTISIPE